MIDWNENEPPPRTGDPKVDAAIAEVCRRVSKAVRSLKDIVIIEDKLIEVGAAGTRVAHGQGRRPRAAVAYPGLNAGSSAIPTVTEIGPDTVLVKVSGANVRANVLLVM